jgi:hypothetical protein
LSAGTAAELLDLGVAAGAADLNDGCFVYD